MSSSAGLVGRLVPHGLHPLTLSLLPQLNDDKERNRQGDDENDALAIRWVLSKGGAGIVVGNRITVPRAHPVEGPAGLARAVREFPDAAPNRDVEVARQGLPRPRLEV